ncbi:hypothetical protein COUCH_30930 [Couchioplanes caeruleus]|uniref:hypothetical protein n=1 Tax=Couchioplanes caeruleus TaxID=56438 RepID=UPI0020BE248D|nr:hypothetical protein [Couchioplanes caeruleus]UQU63391.1 hypothetical protein COUCH_30930 [Couchioplanes caeruleus]
MRSDPARATLVGPVDAGVGRLDITGRRDPADAPELHRLSEAGRLRGEGGVIP